MKVTTGGPAFPSTITDDSLHVQGMTLRDYFAAKAMQSFAKTIGRENSEGFLYDEFIDDLTQKSYRIADSMLRAKEKTE